MGRSIPFLIIALAACGCKWGEANKLPEPKITRLPNSADTATYRKMDAFAFDLLATLKSEDNVVFSPLSVEQTLAVLLNGSSGKTRDELMALVGTDENARDDFNESQRALLNAFKGDGSLKVANAVFTIWPVVLDKFYVNHMGEVYDAGVKKIGSAGIGAVDVANGWISQHTDGVIDDLVKDFSPNEAVVVFSAMHFGAQWETPFEKARKAVFHGDARDYDAQMMSVNGKFRLAEVDGAKFVEVPYKGGAYSMLVALDASPFISLDRLRELDGAAKEQDVRIVLPKLAYTTDIDLLDPISSLGAGSLFTADCNLRIMSIEMETGYRVSRFIHRAEITVDETGTEAAAATAAVAEGGESENQFVADRPFFFAIKHNATGVFCLIGVVQRV